jgi:hypothetical protein
VEVYLNVFLTRVLDVDEQSASRFGRFTPGGAFGTRWVHPEFVHGEKEIFASPDYTALYPRRYYSAMIVYFQISISPIVLPLDALCR